jgi:hypothetical protein
LRRGKKHFIDGGIGVKKVISPLDSIIAQPEAIDSAVGFLKSINYIFNDRYARRNESTMAFSYILGSNANNISDGESATGNTATSTYAGITYAGV